MAGRGPAPKPPSIRQRENRKTNAAILEPRADFVVPDLPADYGREWSKPTLRWWERLWRSPMAARFLEPDRDALERVAVLIDDWHTAESATVRAKLSVEIRLQEGRFGLSPTDRDRLQWEVRESETTEERRIPQRSGRPTDPRAMLKPVQ
jgi:hypothetical protein